MDFNCEICCENFNNSNRKPITVMPCGHSFCLECVEKLKKQDFICPTDREPIVNQKPNYALLNFMSSNLDQTKNVSFCKVASKIRLSLETFLWSTMALRHII